MKIDIVSIFPDFFDSVLQTSIIGRAQAKEIVQIRTHDLREYTEDLHRSVDDSPYGGGGGMVIKPEPVAQAWATADLGAGYAIYLTADGDPLTQQIATQLSLFKHIVLLCGHYKGVDERVRSNFIDREISIGDYVLTGGETAAIVLIDAVVRLIPGVLGNFTSALSDSFHETLLDCPWYTRPVEFAGEKVPKVLLSGDHEEVERWRRRQSLRRTFDRRPELLSDAILNDEERRTVEQWTQGFEPDTH